MTDGWESVPVRVCDSNTDRIITGLLLNPDQGEELHHHEDLGIRLILLGFVLHHLESTACVIVDVYRVCEVCGHLFSSALTFLHHADAETLLKAAVLAAIASPLVHRTVLTGQTHILGIFLNGALRKTQTHIPTISLQRLAGTRRQSTNTLFNSISVLLCFFFYLSEE